MKKKRTLIQTNVAIISIVVFILPCFFAIGTLGAVSPFYFGTDNIKLQTFEVLGFMSILCMISSILIGLLYAVIIKISRDMKLKWTRIVSIVLLCMCSITLLVSVIGIWQHSDINKKIETGLYEAY